MAGPHAIGIDIGGTHLRAGLVTAAGQVLAAARRPSSHDPQQVLDLCLALVAQMRTAAKADPIAGIGIGVPGQVVAATGQVLSGGYVDLSGFPFARKVAAATGLPVTIENDATMALLAEAALGAARGQADVVMLTIGTGIGGAALERGRVLRGAGTAGQLGHLVVDPAGRACVCGRRGCVETTSSGTAFARHLAESGLPAATRVADLLARPDDPVACGVITAWARPLRAAIDSLIAVLNPGCVVLGGGAGVAAVAALARFPAAASWFTAPVLAAELGDDAGVIGAALSALRAGPAGKRAVLVNGVPASGKSRVARALSDATGWPILALDTVKTPYLHELPAGDRDFNRALGRAAYAAMFDVMAQAPAGATFILDAWFGFQPEAVLRAGIARAGIAQVAEVWCSAPPATIGARYGARAAERHPGHPGADYVPELVALAGRARPMALGPVRTVDTTGALDLAGLVAWLDGPWGGAPIAG